MVTMASQTVSVSAKVLRTKTVALRSVQTTGSISASSTSLTVADASGFSVGDWVIVETGGEAGAGARGTMGVGGSYPALSYADATAMNADTSQASNQSCWLRDTGDVYYYGAGTWTQVPADQYYFVKAIPRALVAEITNISGSVLTLSVAATATTTNANVYLDNWGILQDELESVCILGLPAGTFHMSCHIYATGCRRMEIQGAGQAKTILKTPKGAAHGGFDIFDSYAVKVRDLQVDCGFKNDHYSFKFQGTRADDIDAPQLMSELYRDSNLGKGVFLSGCSDSEVADVRVVNPAVNGFGAQFLSGTWFRRCTVRVEDPFREYTQWMIQFPDVTDCGAEDCEVDSDWLVSGFESFKSRNVIFRRCIGRNAFCSMNSADGTLYEDMNLVFEEDSKGLSHRPVSTPIFDNNTNASGGYSTNANVILRPTVVQEGYTDLSNQRRLKNIESYGSAAPLEITGTYDTDPVTPKGLLHVMPSPNATDEGNFGGLGILSDGRPFTVSGIRFQMTMPPGNGVIHIAGTSDPVVSVTNSIFDGSITGDTTNLTASGNQTNAEYEA